MVEESTFPDTPMEISSELLFSRRKLIWNVTSPSFFLFLLFKVG